MAIWTQSIRPFLLCVAATLCVALPFQVSAAPVVTSNLPYGNTSGLVGQPVLFQVYASGAAPLTYKWFFSKQNGSGGYDAAVPISGATSDIFKVTSLATANAGKYYAEVSDSTGTTRSGTVTLVVTSDGSQFPTYTSYSPTTLAISVNGSFVTKVSGVTSPRSASLTYQWFKNDRAISGATSSYYHVPVVSSSHAGNYQLAIRDSYGATRYTPQIPVTIGTGTNVPPRIDIQPASSLNLLLERPTTALAVRVTGDGPLSYQWYKNGVAIAGATGYQYTISRPLVTDSASYYATVRSTYGQATSSTSVVNISEPPAFTTYPNYLVQGNLGAPLTLTTAAKPFDVNKPVTYQWYKNDAALSGKTAPTLTIAALASADVGTYYARASSNGFGISGPDIQVIPVAASAPIITDIVGKYSYRAGETISLKAVAAGTNLRYEWKRQGLTTVLSTTDSLVVPNARTNATYTVVAYNGTVGSFPVSMDVQVLPVPTSRLTADKLAVIVNTRDPYSVEVGEYYRTKRNIPTANMIYVDVPTGETIGTTDFNNLVTQINSKIPAGTQAMALAWKYPALIGCNSITSALSRGYDSAACSNTCGTGTLPANPLYNQAVNTPFTTYGFRPSMMLAANNVAEAKAMIDRGVASDGTKPQADSYVMSTTDVTRSLRMTMLRNTFGYNQGARDSSNINTQVSVADSLKDKTNVLLYFTGNTFVANLKTNTYLPGAVADNLTSFSGKFSQTSQMNILEYVSAGVTGTFGTVSEPCALTDKFTDPRIFARHYGRGDTLIEAYWKSIKTTFQGQFVGEPLAAPYASPPTYAGFRKATVSTADHPADPTEQLQ